MERLENYLTGWLLDGTGNPVIEKAVVEVRDGVFGSVVEIGNDWKDEKKGCEIQSAIDLSGYTVIPALMDCHVHLFMSGTKDSTIRKRQLEAEYEEIKPVIEEHVKSHIAHGVIAVRDGGDRLGHAMRFRDSRALSEVGPTRLKVAGKAWNRAGRYGRLIGRSPREGQSLAEAILFDLINKQANKPDHIKIVNSGINSLSNFGNQTPPQFELDELKDAVKTSNQRGFPVMAHANGLEPVRISVEAGCRSIEHGFFSGEENLKRMADRGVFWVPTACTMKGYAETLDSGSPEASAALRYLDHQLEQMSLGRLLGTPMALGTDAGSMGVNHGSAITEELKLFVEAGFSLEEAVSCATGKAACLLGIGDLGEIRPGKKAAFIAVKGGPEKLLENLSKFNPELPGSERIIVKS